jgi:hypothetical protein
VTTSWCTRATVPPSSHCASSTASTSRAPAARSTRAAVAARRSRNRSQADPPSRSGSRCASAPNGIDAEAAVAAVHSTWKPHPRAAAASRARRVLPTPGAPAIATPPATGLRIAASTKSSSSSRPTSGKAVATQQS